jgi:uncharacterized protein (TIGR02588 family)
MSEGGATDRRQPHTPLVEWVAAGISSVLVLAMLGYTLREALTGPSGPPSLSVHVDSVVPTAGHYLVMFTVRNEGGETAAAVTVHGALLRGDSTLEESDASVDYVPIGGFRIGGVAFTADPQRDSLELRVGGFQAP